MKMNFKIIIPRSAPKLLLLARNIHKQHVELAADSPLESIDMSSFDQVYQQCKLAMDQKEELARRAQAATDTLNRLVGLRSYTQNKESLYQRVLQIRKLLESHYFGHSHQLGGFGFEVNAVQSNGMDTEDLDLSTNNGENSTDNVNV